MGLAFLVCVLIEGAAATLLGTLLRRQFNRSRAPALLYNAGRCGDRHGCHYQSCNLGGVFQTEGMNRGLWGAAVLSEAGVALVDTLFYAAALRGHWR